MKIGIATVHDSSNLGSYLQALGMQEIVKLHGDQPVIVETRSKFSTLCLYLGYNNAKTVRSLKSALCFGIYVFKHPKKMKSRYEKYKIYQKDWKKFEHIATVKQVNYFNLDCLLLGSDEIWNMNQPAFQNPLLYGIGIEAVRKLGYAISVGNVTNERIQQFPELLWGIRSLDAILPRDIHTQEVLQSFSIQTEARICDPTIQVDIRNYMKRPEEVDLPKKNYMVVYSYFVDDEKKVWIQRFAKEHNLKTVAVSLPQEWCDSYLNCSPLEFGAVLSQASYVFTSTFHGTIFSSLYHTKFVSLSVHTKVEDVLRLLGLEDHMLPNYVDYSIFKNMLERDYSFEAMEQKLKQLRRESYDNYERYVKGIEEV